MSNDTERTDEILGYAVIPEGQGGTVKLVASSSDDEGIRQHDTQEVEIEVPGEGVLDLEIKSEGVELVPNSFDGNPRYNRTDTDHEIRTDGGVPVSVEGRIEAAARDGLAGSLVEDVLAYHQDDCETLPAHHLLMALRSVDGIALHFESGDREWLLTANVESDGAAYYRYYDADSLASDDPEGEPKRAIQLEAMLQRELPEIVPIEATGVGR